MTEPRLVEWGSAKNALFLVHLEGVPREVTLTGRIAHRRKSLIGRGIVLVDGPAPPRGPKNVYLEVITHGGEKHWVLETELKEIGDAW